MGRAERHASLGSASLCQVAHDDLALRYAPHPTAAARLA